MRTTHTQASIAIVATAFLLFAVFTQYTHAASTSTPRTEGNLKGEVKASKLLDTSGQNLSGSTMLPSGSTTLSGKVQPSSTATPQTTQAVQTQAVQTQASTLGPNLIPNPSLETAGTGGVPQNWHKGGYGTNTRTLTYPATPAQDGSKAASVNISSYTSGDAKWYFDNVSVTPGSTYQFSNFYQSTVPSEVDIQYTLSNGSNSYAVLGAPAAASSYQNFTAQFIVPTNVVSLTIFHVIDGVGTLTTDNYALNQITAGSPPPPPPPPGNLISNGNFEAGSTNAPTGWGKGGWGTNTRTFSYPVTSGDGSKGAKVTITGYSSGDAKWYFTPLSLQQGVYTFTDQYSSTVPSEIDSQIQNADGSFSYKTLVKLPASSAWTSTSIDLSVPAGTQNVTIFHLINSNGSLSMDNATLQSKSGGVGGVFSTGAVTLRFDDGWHTQLDYAIPKLNSAGLKGTFYLVSQQMSDNGFTDFISIAQAQQMFAQGHEIGAHTRTHPDLVTLSAADQQSEIQGSRQDILGWNVGPVNTFAYPFGSYNATTLQIVKNAGFSSAASTIDGNVTPTSDPYQLERFSVENTTTFAQIKAAIDNAIAKKQWVIFAIHKIQPTGCDQYCTTPTIFNQTVDYLVQTHVPVVTVSQGIQSLQQ